MYVLERIIVADEGKEGIDIFNKHGNFVTSFNISQTSMHCPR